MEESSSTRHNGNAPNIVVIGGGTGSFTILSALKVLTPNITALVNMADDGGSTGVLRDELGVLPPGDVRQCLVALGDSPKMRELFNYRFEEGGLKGHAFGNLFMAALEKMTGNFAEAVELASEVLKVRGRVEPITLDKVRLVMTASNGKTTKGEFQIGHADFEGFERPVISLEPEASINPAAARAIERADLIVIAPGNLYGSLAPALVVRGLTEVVEAAKAKVVYVCNLVTKPGQTDGFKVSDYASEIERFMGVPLDFVLYNNHTPPADLLARYAHDGEYLVQWDEDTLKQAGYQSIGGRFIAESTWGESSNTSDPLESTRSLIRHDAMSVATGLFKVLKYEANTVPRL